MFAKYDRKVGLEYLVLICKCYLGKWMFILINSIYILFYSLYKSLILRMKNLCPQLVPHAFMVRKFPTH